MPLEPALCNAIDIHVHGYPDVGLEWKMRTDDLTLVTLARDAGMRGVVLKSHFWPTMDRAMILNERLDDPQFTVWGSITLNPLIGGLQPTTVEAAAAHGAKVVFLPTWGSRNDHGHGGVVRQQVIDELLPSFGPYLDVAAIKVVSDDGVLNPAVVDILEVAKARELVVSTAHLSPSESLVVAEAAAGIGFTRLVFAHPFSPSISASPEVIDAIAATGAMVEITAVLTMMPRPPISVADVYDTICRLGADRVVLSSDVFFKWLPPHAQMLAMFIGQLRSLGSGEAEFTSMLVDNPARLLGIRTAK
ncbi:hypothetical protein E3O06_10930 [Cryobacterium glaciale]|uniref:Amidohydrolase-related domain-containing protein n=1 Tax=Cryobacterium glaciale TaxID=1259145 RepID=A0A4R8UX42_9MICO|nr:DUF6282 family protein [Cryobacterium glaciale]TFB72116.1 hypothetical protein E3O06_10930 [Cryobacterium glaciale]